MNLGQKKSNSSNIIESVNRFVIHFFENLFERSMDKSPRSKNGFYFNQIGSFRMDGSFSKGYKLLLAIILFFSFLNTPSKILAQVCSPSSAKICVAGDDISTVY